jgi:hypothetical protein
MNRASRALAEAFTTDHSVTYRAIAEKSNVPRSTLHRCKHGGMPKETKAQRQEYLIIEEGKTLVSFLLLMSSLGKPIRKIHTYAGLQHRTPAIQDYKLCHAL